LPIAVSEDYARQTFKFDRGVISSVDSAIVPNDALSIGVNLRLSDKVMPTKCLGRQLYNASQMGSNTPHKGGITYLGEDGIEYKICACNNSLYWTNGNGTMTQVKYLNDNIVIPIDTANHWYNFILFDEVISGVQKKVVYVISDAYPISTASTGTHSKYPTVSRALQLLINSGTIIGKNVFYDSAGTATPGSDDDMVGSGALQVGWPQSGRYGCKIFDRVLIANYSGAVDGYTVCNAGDSQNWTDPSTPPESLTGGGKYPEAYTGCIAHGSSALLFTRHSILNVQATPGDFANWREVMIPTTLGNVGQQIALHSDGWVYFISEEGLARTDGRIAERVDVDIEDQISDLSQLAQNAYSLNLAETDFAAGIPINGDNVFNLSTGVLQQKDNAATAILFEDNTYALFSQGVGTNVTITSSITNALGNLAIDQALNKPTTVYAGGSAMTDGQANDGNPSTFYWYNPQNRYDLAWNVDLGAVSYIQRVIYNFSELYVQANGRSVKIQYSADGTNWTDLYVLSYHSITSGTTYANTLNFSPTLMRWIKVLFMAYTPGSGDQSAPIRCQLVDIEAYGSYYTGSFISRVMDYSTTPQVMGYLFGTVTGAPGTSVTFYTSSSSDNSNWEAWTLVASDGYISSTPARYMKYMAILNNANLNQSTPVLTDVTISNSPFFSPSIDYGETPTTFGNLSATGSNVAGLQFYTASSATDLSEAGWSAATWTLIGAAQDGIAGGIINSTPARYLRWKAVKVSYSGTGLDLYVYVGGQWVSAMQTLLTTPGSWGSFIPSFNLIGQSIVYEMATLSGTTWSAWTVVSAGSVPSVSLSQYVKFRITINTTDATQLPWVSNINLNYFTGTANKSLPTVFSFEDELWCSFASNNSTHNDHVWIGETKQKTGLIYTQSLISGFVFPIWSKRDFVTANWFGLFKNKIVSGDSIGGWIDNVESGTTNRGTAFTSYFLTGTSKMTDVMILARYAYMYSASGNPFNLYYRTRQGGNDWSAWSNAITIPAQTYLSKSNKITFPGIVRGDFIQFMIETTATDTAWAVAQLNVYCGSYPLGR
jgi:hypothetical protein